MGKAMVSITAPWYQHHCSCCHAVCNGISEIKKLKSNNQPVVGWGAAIRNQWHSRASGNVKE